MKNFIESRKTKINLGNIFYDVRDN